jgi:DNA damage-inducible protein 1
MFLFGLDNLKRHQCVLDLKAHALRFGTTGTELKFLAEHEIPAKDNPAAAERLAAAETEAAVAASRAKPAAGGAGGAGGGGAGGSAPAAAAAPSAPAAPSAAPAAAAPAAWEEKVARLAALGFPREACEGALRAAGGDEEMAGSLLFVGA